MEELSKNRLFLVLGDRAFAEDNLPEAYEYYKKADKYGLKYTTNFSNLD